MESKNMITFTRVEIPFLIAQSVAQLITIFWTLKQMEGLVSKKQIMRNATIVGILGATHTNY